MLDEALTHTAVLGAAGKMGSGISLLLLQEMASLQAEGKRQYSLVLVDANESQMHALKSYLRTQLRKFAESRINDLRTYYRNNPKLISNSEMIEYFINSALDLARFSTTIEETRHCRLVFEAIVEDIDIKSQVLSDVFRLTDKNAFFFTNTSSIPINVLNEKASLGGNIIGYHFYNPPAVQKLLEVIPAASTSPSLVTLAKQLAGRLGKTVVRSKDAPGFIGNGHFIPEIIYACSVVERLATERPLYEAVYMVDTVTRQFLIRPMGIFQLVDYVGLDVAAKILNVMRTYCKENEYQVPLIGQMLQAGITGGQQGDGSPKDGFFHYEGSKPSAVYRLEKHDYLPFNEGSWKEQCDAYLGPLPAGHASWKEFSVRPDPQEGMALYFSNLLAESTPGAELAREFLARSREIADELVRSGVAASLQDVATVLKTGFFHLYGPDAPWMGTVQATRSSH